MVEISTCFNPRVEIRLTICTEEVDDDATKALCRWRSIASVKGVVTHVAINILEHWSLPLTFSIIGVSFMKAYQGQQGMEV
ncbi:unnamed protein product [Brassica oleracea var. botrytis]